MIVIGLMSGTSVDGIDAAVVEIEGTPPQLRWRLLAHRTVPYTAAMQAEILACCDQATATIERICALNAALGRAFAQAALLASADAGLAIEQVDLIGSHGQTIWHIPAGEQASTLQIGEAAYIAELCGVPVVSNFRPRDMAAGGQGAPLVPAVDALLLSEPGVCVAAQNIGGIANVTFLPAEPGAGQVLAFDTGPGNMLIDDAVRRLSGGRLMYDTGGALALSGRISGALLEELLDEPFLQQPPPRTTGRELFGAGYGLRIAARARELGLADADLVATLTAFTAHSIADAYRRFLPRMPERVLVSGGGAHNLALMGMLRDLLAPAEVQTSAAAGLPPDAKEAIAFAVLAYESWHGRPGNLPAATGARQPVILGSITPGARRPPQAPPAPAGEAALSLTEQRNPASADIDLMPALELARIMNDEDGRVAAAIRPELPAIAEAIERIAERMRRGGRLIYVGAGTSGRLGVLAASECPPTYSTPPGLVVGLIAGGERALTQSVEAAEDDPAAGAAAVAAIGLQAEDTLVGLAASGSTPYVLGALEEAGRRGALTVSIACTRPARIAEAAQIAITPLVGPEVVTGSTRMKAGSAQKMVLNMLSTGVMVQLGKTYGNLMVDVRPTNAKLRRRALRIVQQVCAADAHAAQAALDASGGEVKTAIVMLALDLDAEQARARLQAAGGVTRRALRPNQA
jgi:N-acetylmuramic acid 6-phosphate etherase